MSDHHREQKANIISAAFSEWSKTHFTSMSLAKVAKKLSLTKPALYRYFKNKAELLQTMVTTLVNDLSAGAGCSSGGRRAAGSARWRGPTGASAGIAPGVGAAARSA